MNLLSKDDLRKVKTDIVLSRGIYFLFDNDEIVYVGQSKRNVLSRISAHINDKNKIFDSWSYVDCDGGLDMELNDLEAEYIVKFNPKYNSNLPINNKYVYRLYIRGYLRNRFGDSFEFIFSRDEIDKIIKEITDKYGDYCPIDELLKVVNFDNYNIPIINNLGKRKVKSIYRMYFVDEYDKKKICDILSISGSTIDSIIDVLISMIPSKECIESKILKAHFIHRRDAKSISSMSGIAIDQIKHIICAYLAQLNVL